MILESITNRGEFFSYHYLDAVIGNDIGDLRSRWEDIESRGEDTARSRIRAMSRDFFDARAEADEATDARRAEACRALNDVVLRALGYTPARAEVEMLRGSVDVVRAPLAHETDTGSGRLLVALDASLVADPDRFFDDTEGAPGELLDPLWREDDKQRITKAPDAVTELFAVDEPPRYVLVVGGRVVLLAERSKWGQGRFLAVDLDAALERRDIRARGELETIAALFSADALVPEEGQSIFDELVESSHKHAVGVSKDLRDGIRQSVEILANEVIEQRLAANLAVYSGPNAVDPKALTRQCLRWLYRLLVLLYAESRPDLGVLPVDDVAYMDGYSLDRLRQLCLVPLDSDRARQGSHIHESLQRLFDLVNQGYHQDSAQQAFTFDAIGGDEPSTEEYLQFPGLDAALFDENAAPLLDSVTLRNEALQKLLAHLMLSPEGKTSERGFISYAQLGINQLGAVYEGLMAYSGFFANTDLYEVAKGGDPTDGTWVLPVDQADGYPEDVFVSRTDPVTGRAEYVRHPRGSFVFRLSGRDRQRSASYYTPEVLTQCVVKHALAELLGLDDYAPENGSSGITEARQILDITICEPALGSGAFLNEAINQLSAEYLRRRMIELDETLDPEEYRRKLQKVKAHFALHQCYGVDLNATAVELAEVSLWLNCMHPGLKAPWFGLQLRRGNSLIGCRRATWRVDQLANRPWANTKKGQVVPPVDRKLADGRLDDDEIHHFLLPGHGWAAVADRKEAKELRPDETEALRVWRKRILKAPSRKDAVRLRRIAQAVEMTWGRATALIEGAQRALRRPIEVYGADPGVNTPISRTRAAEILDPDVSAGRLRALMDAWVGLWFWPLDSRVAPPTWHEWLHVAEALVNSTVEAPGAIQAETFDDLLAAEQRDEGFVSVDELRKQHPWLAVAIDAAQREGAWHWELEFAPVFKRGGFDLQVGNPPWTKLYRTDTGFGEDLDPKWAFEGPPQGGQLISALRTLLKTDSLVAAYMQETATSEATRELLSSPLLRPVTHDLLLNLYMVFMDTTWRHLAPTGVVGLLHPESHFTDPKASYLRQLTYQHLRRHFQFVNELMLFEDIGHPVTYGIHSYGAGCLIKFVQCSSLLHPDTANESLSHDGTGELPGIQFASGGWDLRPHKVRVLTISEDVLADWARLFDEPGTPATQARLLRPVTTADLEALSVLADQPARLTDYDYSVSPGWHEKGAKDTGIVRWETAIPPNRDEVILQGPHFTIATPFAKQPNENCRSKGDYSDWDLENLSERVIPRTNYQRATDKDTYEANLDYWDGKPSKAYWRHIHREMTQPGLERSVQGCIIPPGATHIHACLTYGFEATGVLVRWAAVMSSLPADYLFKASGATHVAEHQLSRLPVPHESPLDSPSALRTLRLNCLTADYSPLWGELYDSVWQHDDWTDLVFHRVRLGDVESEWTMDTPLRRDFERRLALVELDALAALMLGLTAEQLCAMYRTQFAVLRKYEHKMVFDAEGRKICGYHQSAGYRQAQLQEQAKVRDLPKAWTNLWRLYEQYEADPSSIDWMGHYTPPFYRPDREKEMTRAYEEFSRRLDEGFYG